MERFEGRVAVVTGAASGIGRALAERCAAEGMKVVLADVEAGALGEVARAIEGMGAEALAVPTDVSQADQVDALAKRAVDAFGSVHLVCNNAGVFAAGLSWEAPLSDYEWVFAVNVWGVIHGVRAFLPLLLQEDEGHVVNTASMAGVTSTPFCAPYTISKHAVVALSETLHLELQARQARVGVSVLCPELVATRIGQSARNRPAHLERPEGEQPERDLVERAIQESTAGGLPPERMADRVFDAVRAGRFYILAPPGDPWRAICEARLDQVRTEQNPVVDLSDAG